MNGLRLLLLGQLSLMAMFGSYVPNFGTSVANGISNPLQAISNVPTATFQQVQDNPQTAGATTLTVTSTSGWPSQGCVIVGIGTGAEAECWSSTDATHLNGLTRGNFCTAAAAHALNANMFPITAVFPASATACPQITTYSWGAAANSGGVIFGKINNTQFNPSGAATTQELWGTDPGSTIHFSNFRQIGGVYTSFSSAFPTYLRTMGTVGNNAINLSDDKATTINLNSGNGITKIVGGGLQSAGTKFTASGCSNSATVGGATAGQFTSGTTGACTVTITMAGATGATASNGWSCHAADLTTPANLYDQSASTTTTATLTGTTVSGDVIAFFCMAF